MGRFAKEKKGKQREELMEKRIKKEIESGRDGRKEEKKKGRRQGFFFPISTVIFDLLTRSFTHL